MPDVSSQPPPPPSPPEPEVPDLSRSHRPICQICSGRLIEIRAKLQCERCHTIWETCCEGGRG